MITKRLRMACVSDVHLGHHRTHTTHIVENLDRKICNSAFLKTIDLLVIAGDLFDRLLNFASEEARISDMWINRLLRKCAKYNVIVRVLEGTPSHDRKQSTKFIDNNSKLEKAGVKFANMRYVDVLEIEYLEEFGANVLYLPDEWGTSPEDAFDQVKKLMVEKNLEKVDFAIMHGMFDYQLLADIPSIPRHNSRDWLEIVEYLIFIGHVHVFSTHQRIIAQGSFDRISHGEEDPKGFVRAEIEPNGDYVATFIENENALKYITFRPDDSEMMDCLLKLQDLIRTLPDGSHVRVSAKKEHPILENIALLEEKWPLINWSNVVSAGSKSDKITDVLATPLPTYTPVNIDRHSVMEVMSERLRSKLYPSALIDACLVELKDIRSQIPA